MRKLDGFSLLTICICCCIFVSLGYVKLFNELSQKVNRPDTAEFWQLRSLALSIRNPAVEARAAFEDGNLASFDTEALTDSSNHRVAELASNEPGQSMANLASASGFGDFLQKQDPSVELASSHAKFVDASTQFALEYDRELTRLINNRQDTRTFRSPELP